MLSSLVVLVLHGCTQAQVAPSSTTARTRSTQNSGEQAQLAQQPSYVAPGLVPFQRALERGDAAEAVRQIELRWKKQFEDHFSGQFTTPLMNAPAIATVLQKLQRETGKKSALIYAVPMPTHLDLILILPGQRLMHRRIQAANEATLFRTASTFRSETSRLRRNASRRMAAARQLHQWLIEPFEPLLRAQAIDLLVFCLGTNLRSIPLAALHDGKQFLVEQYSLALIPAFSLLDVRRASLGRSRVLAMGASRFEQLPPLPATAIEVSAIAEQLGRGSAFLNERFTLANLLQQRRSYPYEIVHLATHAEFSPGAPRESYIQFWDHRLRLDRIKELSLQNPPVHLLVLSACRTALGDPEAELGFAGLAIQSGARSAIASMWAVSDAATLVLMTEFYRRLGNSPIKAEALRQAQLAMLRQNIRLENSSVARTPLPPELKADADADLSHPFYWAAFTVIGNPW
jgi:CHAT domain-containing protein